VDRIVSRFEYREALGVAPDAGNAEQSGSAPLWVRAEAAAESMRAWEGGLRCKDVTNPRTRCQSQMVACLEDATVYIGRELLDTMPEVVHAKLAEVINDQTGRSLNERNVRVLASLLACPSEERMAAALTHLQVGRRRSP
jgi:hypothetical protein